MEIRQEIKIPFKFPHQSNLPLPGAPTEVFDASQPNNGMNRDASRYSNNKAGQQVKFVLEIVASVTADGEQTTYIEKHDCIILGNGDKGQGGNDWDPIEVELYTEDGADLLGSGTSFTAYDNRNMLMKATLTNRAGNIGAYFGAFGIHYVQKSTGGNDIFEFSSLRDNRTDIPQQPVTGETHLKVEYSGDSIITSCLIDGTKLQVLQTYNFTAFIDFTP